MDDILKGILILCIGNLALSSITVGCLVGLIIGRNTRR